MNIKKPEVGDVIQSIQGRDEGNLYVVYMVSDNYAFCVNGYSRTMTNPKKKKFKHITFADVQRDEELAKKLKEHQKVLDSEIRKAIHNLKIVS